MLRGLPLFPLTLLGVCRALHVNTTVSSSRSLAGNTLMLVSGVSAASEMCLTAVAGSIRLEACDEAIAVGDGRELWAFQTGGHLLHLMSKQCADAGGHAAADVALADCASASTWEMLGNSQLRSGSLCLSQRGLTAGSGNVAARAAAAATSSADAAAHGAAAATDLEMRSYWASKLDDAGTVDLTVDMGHVERPDSATIEWEFPPKAFAVAVAEGSGPWREVFATTVNMLRKTRILLGGLPASRLKVTMREPHPLLGHLSGHRLYGIRSLSVMAPRLQAVMEDCAVAARSNDARDKYFAVAVPTFEAAGAVTPQGDLEELDSAKASLSTVLGKVSDIVPRLPMCGKGPLVSSLGGGFGAAALAAGAVARMSAADQRVEFSTAQELLGTAKSAIVQVRSALR